MKYYLGKASENIVLEANKYGDEALDLVFFNGSTGRIPLSIAILRNEVSVCLLDLEKRGMRHSRATILEVPFSLGELRFLDYILRENVVPVTMLPVHLDCYSCRIDVTLTRHAYFTSDTSFYAVPLDVLIEELKSNLSKTNPDSNLVLLSKTISLSASSQKYLFYTLGLLEGYTREVLNCFIDQFDVEVGDLRYWVSRHPQLTFLQAFYDRDYLNSGFTRCINHLDCFFGMCIGKDRLKSELHKFLYTYTDGNFELFSILLANNWGIAQNPLPAPRSRAFDYASGISSRLSKLLKSVVADETRTLVKSLDYFIN
jgi:hypothetical protein